MLNSERRIARAGRNAREVLIPKIEVTGLGDYVRNVGYKTGAITFTYETMTPNYDRGVRLLADMMDIEEGGVLDDYSHANPTMSNRILERFARMVEVPQVLFYTAIDLKSGEAEFGYAKASTGKAINFMVVEKSTVIKFDKHVASRVFRPDELENLDSTCSSTGSTAS